MRFGGRSYLAGVTRSDNVKSLSPVRDRVARKGGSSPNRGNCVIRRPALSVSQAAGNGVHSEVGVAKVNTNSTTQRWQPDMKHKKPSASHDMGRRRAGLIKRGRGERFHCKRRSGGEKNANRYKFVANEKLKNSITQNCNRKIEFLIFLSKKCEFAQFCADFAFTRRCAKKKRVEKQYIPRFFLQKEIYFRNGKLPERGLALEKLPATPQVFRPVYYDLENISVIAEKRFLLRSDCI